MKELSIDEFKKISFDTLQYFKYFCEKNDIVYSLGFGTLLGAIRHNGFIPWDDDIDVFIDRENFEKLIKKEKQFETDTYMLSCARTNKDYSLPLVKIVDKRTVVYQKFQKKDKPIGVWIDLFILDRVPRDEITRARFYKHLEKLQINWLRLETDYSTVKGFIGFCKRMAVKALGLFTSARDCSIKLDKYSRKYECDKSGLYGICTYRARDRETGTFDAAWFAEYIDARFESEKFRVPVRYDEILKKLYGNYMELPPVEKRISQHNFTAYWRDGV